MRFQAIERCRGSYPVRMMCRCLKVSPAGYYAWRKRPLSERERENQRLLKRIQTIYHQSDGVKGSPRVWEDLRSQGETCSQNRVAKLMKEKGLRGVPQRKKWRKRISGKRPEGIKNLLNRDFSAEGPNQKWATDITFVRTEENWLYLCVVLDLYSGIVIGWAMDGRQDHDLVLAAVRMADWQRRDDQEVILHSDRGTQYTCEAYQHFLETRKITCSMSAVGSCADNAAVEGFFGLLKRERIHRRKYRTKAEARSDIFDYIERFHNPRRRRRLMAVK